MSAAIDWWRARSPREQKLIAVMLALIVLLGAWLLVVRPLADALDAAQRDHQEAVTLLAEARARAAARAPAGEAGGAVPLPVDAYLSRSAAEAGFANARIAGQGPQAATVAIDAVRPQAFFGWVRSIERQGLAVQSLTARINADRTLAVEAAFRARRG